MFTKKLCHYREDYTKNTIVENFLKEPTTMFFLINITLVLTKHLLLSVLPNPNLSVSLNVTITITVSVKLIFFVDHCPVVYECSILQGSDSDLAIVVQFPFSYTLFYFSFGIVNWF